MISSQTPTQIEVTVEQTKTTYFSFTAKDDLLVSFIAVDEGDGYRPFHPLSFKLDGTVAICPLNVDAGDHTIELTGESFDGVGLLVVGYGLHKVTRWDIGSEASALAVKVSAIPKTLEGNGEPGTNLLTGINGSTYLDLLKKTWHKEVSGAWQQQP